MHPGLACDSSFDAEPCQTTQSCQIIHVAIDMFLVFDNLSFYLAIASIMLALIPNLPIDKEGNLHVVKSGKFYL
jgi:hypothetical protein